MAWVRPKEALPSNSHPVLNDIARLRIPSGYTVRPLKEKITMQNGMQAMPIERYAGGRFDVYRYRLTNSTGQVQELAEEMFGTPKGVRAVSFLPEENALSGGSDRCINHDFQKWGCEMKQWIQEKLESLNGGSKTKWLLIGIAGCLLIFGSSSL